MKKFFSVGLAIVMLILCVTPVLAGSQSMEISTSADRAEYELTYPADIEIPWQTTAMDIGEVTATKMLIEPGKMVKVSVSSQNEFKLVNEKDGEKTIAYSLLSDDISFFPGDYGESFTLSVEVEDDEWLHAASGKHSDILTFTAEYTDAV
ncbi:MAG: hypothetical protein E7528_06715 [Ruminococcaceae bacterium]|nr:hypothetical protein [Oscillospiraceae bacterium]